MKLLTLLLIALFFLSSCAPMTPVVVEREIIVTKVPAEETVVVEIVVTATPSPGVYSPGFSCEEMPHFIVRCVDADSGVLIYYRMLIGGMAAVPLKDTKLK
jgi:hypothetical protein